MFHSFEGKIIYSAKTDRGLKRNVNQDAIAAYTRGNLGLFVLSDGMGGHSRGELASQAIVQEFDKYWQQLVVCNPLPDFQTLVTHMQQLIMVANNYVFVNYNRGQICGATVVVLLVLGDCYAVFSVGDSRIYRLKGRKLSQVTTDDIWDLQPDTLINFTPEQIARHESSGKLTQAVGTRPQINIHVITDRMKKGQVFLLSSDGLFKFCEESEIEKELRKVKSEDSMKKVMDTYMRKVFDNGAGDNVSIILVRVV